MVLKDFRFADGESLPELRIHYTTLGEPHRNAQGEIDNAVMVLHGTGGDGHQFLRPQFADELYGPGQPLDIAQILDHPSRQYRPRQIVQAVRRAANEIPEIRLCRHGRGAAPDADRRARHHAHAPDHGHVDGLHAQLHLGRGLSRLRERADAAGLPADRDCGAQPHVAADGDRRDQEGSGLERRQLHEQPVQGLRTAEIILFIAGAAPLNLPDRTIRPAKQPRPMSKSASRAEMNEARRQRHDLPVRPRGTTIRGRSWRKSGVPMTWVNSADDFINPRNLDRAGPGAKRMKTVRFRLIPESADTHGHGTHTWARSGKRTSASFWRARRGDVVSGHVVHGDEPTARESCGTAACSRLR